MNPKITLQEFIEQLKLLKEAYIKRGWDNHETAEERQIGRYQELYEILFELENNVKTL